MALNNITQKVIDFTEERTGRPVLVTLDASLSLLATVKLARGSAAVHVVAYSRSFWIWGRRLPGPHVVVFERTLETWTDADWRGCRPDREIERLPHRDYDVALDT